MKCDVEVHTQKEGLIPSEKNTSLLYLGGNHAVEPLLLSDDEDEHTPGPCSVRRALRTVALHAILVHSRAFETLSTT